MPPSGSTAPEAEQLNVWAVGWLVEGLQAIVGGEGVLLVNVITLELLVALVPPWPSVAVAWTVTGPGTFTEYVVLAPVAEPTLPVADQL